MTSDNLKAGEQADEQKKYSISPLEFVMEGEALDGARDRSGALLKKGIFHHYTECLKSGEFHPLSPQDIVEARDDFNRGYFLLEQVGRRLATDLACYFFGKGMERYSVFMHRRSHSADGYPLSHDKEKFNAHSGLEWRCVKEEREDGSLVDREFLEETINLTSMIDQVYCTPDEDTSFMDPRTEGRIGRSIAPFRTSYHYQKYRDDIKLHTDVRWIELRFKNKGRVGQKVAMKLFGFDEYLNNMSQKGKNGKIRGADYGVADVVGIRIITGSKEDCYKVFDELTRRRDLDLVAGRHKDYIKKKKDNGYQGLHTSASAKVTQIAPGIKRRMVDIQIRSVDMHEQAENDVDQSKYHSSSSHKERLWDRFIQEKGEPYQQIWNEIKNQIMFFRVSHHLRI